MQSMTGFGAIETDKNNLKLNIRIRAVNGRFLELRTQLPPEYFPIEAEIKKIVSDKLKRGTIDISIYRKANGDKSKVEITANEEFAKQWCVGYRKLAKSIGLKDELNMGLLLKMPQVLKVEEKAEFDKEEKIVLFEQLSKVIELCEKERSREGKAIAKDLKELLKSLEKNLSEIAKNKSVVDSEIEKKYKDRLSRQLESINIDPQRIAQELVIQLDKLDITEELFRLREHISMIRDIAFATDKASSPVGKKLDFYSQELLREVNTIGSKCQNAFITKYIVESKGLIERFREIVQNVE